MNTDIILDCICSLQKDCLSSEIEVSFPIGDDDVPISEVIEHLKNGSEEGILFRKSVTNTILCYLGNFKY